MCGSGSLGSSLTFVFMDTIYHPPLRGRKLKTPDRAAVRSDNSALGVLRTASRKIVILMNAEVFEHSGREHVLKISAATLRAVAEEPMRKIEDVIDGYAPSIWRCPACA